MKIMKSHTSRSTVLTKLVAAAFAMGISFSHSNKKTPPKATPNILHTFPTPIHSENSDFPIDIGNIELSISQNISGINFENLPVYILRQRHYGAGYSCMIDASSASIDGLYAGPFFLKPRVFVHENNEAIGLIKSRLDSIRYTEHSGNYHQLGTQGNWLIISGNDFYFFQNEPVELICLFHKLGCVIASLEGCPSPSFTPAPER